MNVGDVIWNYLPSSERFSCLLCPCREVGSRFQFGQHDHTLLFNSCLDLGWMPELNSESKAFAHALSHSHSPPPRVTLGAGLHFGLWCCRIYPVLIVTASLTSLLISLPPLCLYQAELNCILLLSAKYTN